MNLTFVKGGLSNVRNNEKGILQRCVLHPFSNDNRPQAIGTGEDINALMCP